VIVEARTPGTVIYGTPAQFRRAAVRLGTEEPRVCVQAIDAMALSLECFVWWTELIDESASLRVV
jgi:hypothetical protein